jgi:hypothetical protein
MRRRGVSRSRPAGLQQPHRMGEPLELDLAGLVEDHAGGRGRLGDALADQDLAGAGVGGDPGGQVDRAAAGTRPGPPQRAGLLELALDALDEMLGPRQLLLAAVDAQQRRVPQPQAVGVGPAEPGQPARSKVPLDRPSCSSGTTASSSSRIGSSGPPRANPIDSSTAPSVSSGTPVSWLTWR